LTGALILVAALVIIVPEMLFGIVPEALFGPRPTAVSNNGTVPRAASAGPPVRTYEMEFGGTSPRAAAQGQSALASTEPVPAVTEQPAPEPPVTEPVPPIAAAPAAPVPVAQPERAAAAPVSVPAAERPAAKPADSSAKWWAQLGSFSAQENAERLARELRGRGFAVEVSRARTGSKELFRVRAGPVNGRDAAVSLQKRLAAAGHKAALVAP
jgi:cell division protein FtsN